MPSNIIGIRNNNVLVPYSAATKRTKQLDLSSAVTSNPTVSAVTRAVAVFYADSSGVWRMKFNVRYTVASGSRTSATMTIADVVFKATADQSVVAFSGGGPLFSQAYTTANTGNVSYQHASGTTDYYAFSGDVELNAEPTTYTTAANMEGVTAVDVWIGPASASAAGLVSTEAQTFAGVKTYNDGLKLDDAAGQSTLNHYEEGTFSVISQGPWTATTQNLTGRYVRIGKQVTIVMNEAIFATNKSQTVVIPAANGFPAAIRPASGGVQWLVPTYESTVYPDRPGRIVLFYDGSAEIFQQWNGSSFAGSGNGGFLAHTASYTIG